MVSNLVLRYYDSGDAQQCSSLMQDHFRNHATNLPIEVRTQIANSRTAEYVQKITKDRIIVVALVDDEIVGMGTLKDNEIRHMYVQSEYQKKGVSSAILNFIEKEAYYKGYSSLVVNSIIHSIKFYLKNGFRSLIKTQIERHGCILEAILVEKIIE
ncbi:MAG: GNAT family N-acetyltransferase [Promethearchaeota archaeon]